RRADLRAGQIRLRFAARQPVDTPPHRRTDRRPRKRPDRGHPREIFRRRAVSRAAAGSNRKPPAARHKAGRRFRWVRSFYLSARCKACPRIWRDLPATQRGRMVPAEGIEPPTFGLQIGLLSYNYALINANNGSRTVTYATT